MSLPNPDTDIVQTKKWLKLEHPQLATPSEKVILNNLEVLALQSNAILRQLAIVMATTEKLKKGYVRSPRGSVSEASTGGDVDSQAGEETTGAAAAMENLKDVFQQTMYDAYLKWIDTSMGGNKKRKIYVSRGIQAGRDANAFMDQQITDFTAVDSAHPIPPLIELLNSDLKLDLYVALGKQKRSADKASKEVAARSADAEDEDPGATTSAGQAKKRKRDTSGPAGLADMDRAENEPGSSFEHRKRRASQKTRFEAGAEDYDEEEDDRAMEEEDEDTPM